MLGENELKRVADMVLNLSPADQTEVLLMGGDAALTRFANNHIHQNVQETNVTLLVRLVYGQKIGVASGNDLSEQAVRALLKRGEELARHQVDNRDFKSLPVASTAPRVPAFMERTARCGPEERASVVGAICRRAREAGLVAAGAFKITAGELAVANSLGTWNYHRETTAEITTVVMSETSSGFAGRASMDVGDIDGEEVAEEAVERALRSQNPQELELGEYEVVLEGYAVADILDFLAYLGFGAQAYQEKRSFISGRLGQRVMGANVTIWDDGLAADTIPTPFDFEGVPKQRVDLITEGVAQGAVWDSYTAGKEPGQASTGHALPAGTTFGPIPMNLFLRPGEASKEELIRSTTRGILVTRFWYTRPVHPLHVIVTGMTRDGTFLIEKGQVTRPIKNFRFTQGYVEALNNVELIGRETTLQPAIAGYSRVPALKIARWNFSGATQF